MPARLPLLTSVLHSCAIESLEPRRLLAGDAVVLAPEATVPGDLEIGAAPNRQIDPHIAAGPGGTTLALWTDYRTGGTPYQYFGISNGTMGDIWAARIASDGTVIDDLPIAINHDDWNQTHALAAWNEQANAWLVAWHSEQDPSSRFIHAIRLSADGQMLDDEPILIMDNRARDEYGNPIDPSQPLDVEALGEGWFVTWERNEPNPTGPYGSDDVFYVTRVAGDGTVLDADGRRLASSSDPGGTNWIGMTYSPSNGGQYLQMLSTEYMNASYQMYDVLYTRRFDANLNPIDAGFRSTRRRDINAFQAELVGSPSGWMAAYAEDGGVGATRFGTDGVPLDLTSLAIAGATGDPRVGAAFDGTDWVVSYADYGPGDSSGFEWRLNSRRVPVTGAPEANVVVLLPQNPIQNVDALGIGGGRYRTVAVDSTGGMLDIGLVQVEADDTTTVITDISLAARGHSTTRIASDGTHFLSAFLSFNEDVTELKAIRLDNTGQPLDAEPFTIVADAMNPSSYEIVHFGGRYVVIFSADAGDGSGGRTIYGQQVGSDGGLIGSPVTLTTTDDFIGFNLGDASVLGDRLLLTGNNNEGSLHTSRRFAQIFDASLVPVTARFEIGTGYVLSGDVAPVGDRWLATWSWMPTHDAPRAGIAYIYILTDGTTTDAAGLVSIYPTNGTPTVVSAGPGSTEAMIIFGRQDLPPELGGPIWFPRSGEGIVGQRMGADGTRIGDLITLVDEAGSSVEPRATFDGSNYILTWVDSRNHLFPDQETPDVYAARIAIDGTVLDPGGFPIANSHAPEDRAIAVSGGGRTFFAYRQVKYEHPWASYRITTRMLDDLVGPTTSQSPHYQYERSSSVGIIFDERLFPLGSTRSAAVLAGGLAEAMALQNLTTGVTLDRSRLVVDERPGAAGMWEYAWSYTSADGTRTVPLPDGNYLATLSAGSVVDKAGNPLAETVQVSFFVLAGDADRDRDVDFFDFLTLRSNYGQSDKLFSDGDFDYDSDVDFFDFLILRGSYGTHLAPPLGSLFADGRASRGGLSGGGGGTLLMR